MNTSQFMDKQILDLMNPQEESSSNPHRINSSSNGEDAARDREEMVPSYDFQPIRTTTAAASSPPSTGGICTGGGGGGSGPAWGSLDSRLGSSNLRSAGLLEPQVLTEIKQPHKEERSLPAVSISEIDRTVKKYADTVLHALEGVSARLAQLESRTHHVESAVDDLRNVVGDYNGSNDGKLRHFENILREVQSGVQILRDKQEIVETQMQLSKMSPPSKPTSSSDTIPSDISQTQTQPQQLALPAPNPPQYAPQMPQPNPPPPPPSQYAPQMPPQTTPNAPPPPPPQYQSAPNMPPQYPPQTQSAPNAPPPPPPPPSQYAPQMPHQTAPIPPQYPPQSLQSTPSVPPYFPSQPNQQAQQAPPPYTTLSQLHQEELNSNPNAPPPPYMQQPPQTYPPRGPSPPYMQQQQQTGPTYGPPPPAMYTNEPRPNYGPPPDSSYPYGGGSPSYRMNKPNNSNNSSPFSSGGLPTAKILPQAAGPVGSGSGGRVAIDDVVEKVAMMGFSREQVRGTVRKLTENGQNVDLNVVLDKLMNDGDIIQPNKAGWFNR